MKMLSPHAARPGTLALLAALCLAGAVPGVRAQGAAECGSLANPYGPYDYRNQRDKIKAVEDYHFFPAVETMMRPTGGIFGDMDYTLRAAPNHHRALVALAGYSERTKADTLGPYRSIDCYFDRAMRFAKDDPIVRMIYAGHLGRTNRRAQAMAQLDYVVQIAGENAFTHYNAGLIYLEIKQYDKALQQAHVAMQLGLPRTELRDALKKAGKWTEPAPAATPAEAASAAAPAS